MKRYVVISPDTDSGSVSEKFPDNYELLEGQVWVVAAQQSTCADVCEALGIGKEQGMRGVVTTMEDYYGFYDRALWEKASAWGAQA